MALTKEALLYLLENEDPKIGNFIGNQFVPASCGEYMDSEDPSTGKTWLKVANSNSVDVEAAVNIAHKAFDT